MLLTLPLILFIVMTELSIGAFAVLFLLDWRNQVKRSFLVTYAIIYLFLTGLTYLFQQNYSTPALLNTFTLLDKAWTGYLPLPLLLFLGVLAHVIFAFTGTPATAAHSQGNSATPTATATTAISAATPTSNPQAKPANVPTITPLSTDAIGWLRIVVAFVIPLILLTFILKLIRDRSFQSATGMLYLVVVLTLAGEAMARGLFLIGLQ